MEVVDVFLSYEGSPSNKPLGEAATIKKIDKKFSKKKSKGLSMLEDFLKSCSDAAFTENCVKWLQQCCKFDGDDMAVNERSLNVFSELMKFAVKFPELVRPITNSVVTRFADVFVKKLTGCEAAWEALEVVMGAYSGPLAAQKETLETMMIEKITGVEPIKEFEARCFALLPSVGGGGVKGLAYRNNWRAQFDRFHNTCHHILNRLFMDVRELQEYDTDVDSALTFEEGASFSDLVCYFSNTSRIMQAMMLDRFAASKMIPVDAVLSLACRGLSVTGATLGTKDLERNTELREELPQLHDALLRTLAALVVCCGRTLLPVASVVAKLLGQALAVASDFTDLRVTAYSLVSNWLTVARSGSCVDRIAKSLIATILGDIQYKRPPVILKDKSKKSNEPVRNQMVTFSGRETVCFAALKTLDLAIHSVGYQLSADQHKTLQTVVIQVATDIQRHTEQSTAVYGTAPHCRAALFAVLLQLCLEPSPRWPPPTQFAFELLRRGQNDSDPAVSATCSAGITMLERIVHPEFSIAAFPVDYSNVLKDPESNEVESQPTSVSEAADTEEVTQPFYAGKLVTKSSSPWEPFSPRITKPESRELIVLDGAEDTDGAPVIMDSSNVQTQQKHSKKLEPPVAPIQNGAPKDAAPTECGEKLKKSEHHVVHNDSTTELIFLDDDDSPEPRKKQKLTETMSSPPLGKSDSKAVTKHNETEKPQPTANASPPLKDENSSSSSSSKPGRLRSRYVKPSSEVNIDSPMALRSGAVVGGSSFQPLRVGSVASVSSQGSSLTHTTYHRVSPRSEMSESEDALALFDDTVRPDYK